MLSQTDILIRLQVVFDMMECLNVELLQLVWILK